MRGIYMGVLLAGVALGVQGARSNVSLAQIYLAHVTSMTDILATKAMIGDNIFSQPTLDRLIDAVKQATTLREARDRSDTICTYLTAILNDQSQQFSVRFQDVRAELERARFAAKFWTLVMDSDAPAFGVAGALIELKGNMPENDYQPIALHDIVNRGKEVLQEYNTIVQELANTLQTVELKNIALQVFELAKKGAEYETAMRLKAMTLRRTYEFVRAVYELNEYMKRDVALQSSELLANMELARSNLEKLQFPVVKGLRLNTLQQRTKVYQEEVRGYLAPSHVYINKPLTALQNEQDLSRVTDKYLDLIIVIKELNNGEQLLQPVYIAQEIIDPLIKNRFSTTHELLVKAVLQKYKLDSDSLAPDGTIGKYIPRMWLGAIQQWHQQLLSGKA